MAYRTKDLERLEKELRKLSESKSDFVPPDLKLVSRDALLKCLDEIEAQTDLNRIVVPDPRNKWSTLSTNTVRKAINQGVLTTFEELDYAVFRLTQQAQEQLKDFKA